MDTSRFNPLGDVVSVEKTTQGVLLGVGEEKFRVDVLRVDLLRLKISQAGRFDDSPTFAASFQEPSAPPFKLDETDDTLTLDTGRLKLVVGKQPFTVDAFRADGSVIFEDSRDDVGNGGYRQLNDSFMITRRIGPHDSIYGLGEKTGHFDRRGRTFILWNTDVLAQNVLSTNRLHEADLTLNGRSTNFDPYYASIPFFYHCRANNGDAKMAGFFIDNGYKANVDFSSRNQYSYRFGGGQYTEYVFAGPNMADILSAYTFVTGRMQAPPMWALGHHQCRFHDYTDEQILAIGRTYRERDIPCDVLWLDIGYMDGYRVFTWDKTKFCDVPGMIEKMKAHKLRLVTIVDPGVKAEVGYSVFDEGRARNLFCKTEAGQHYVGHVWPGRTVFPDFVKPEARGWWSELNAGHVQNGIAGIWNDMNEPATADVEPFAMRFDRDGANHPHERYHNQYALLMAMATHQGMRTAQPHVRPFILSRAGFAGIQRYAAQWLGDNCSDWNHLQMSVPMSMGMGISGQPFIGGDIPGFSSTPTPELAVRWTQYGALTPFCRFHNEAGEPDQYPWSFGPGVEKRSRAALDLRYRLLPYIYSAFMRASETGEPVQRPFVYDFQNDRHARETEDAYLFGDALLVAPVLGLGHTARHVYLPQGTWIDWYTGEKHPGGQFITAAAPLDRIPLFARGGRVIPGYSTTPRSTMDHHPDRLELRVVVPDEDGEFYSCLHEDDGLTDAHLSGAFLRTTFCLARQGDRVRVNAKVTGNGYPEFRRRLFRLTFLGCRPDKLALGGGELRTSDGSLEFDNHGEDFELTFAAAVASSPLASLAAR
ncbi:MAG TPA: glycoside hydrolase family 31 protein [Polyangia bacterium]|jgi:alpha-glucosidase|nr:glycoside hydrolase family 31 protein [Polyangia bacterium]